LYYSTYLPLILHCFVRKFNLICQTIQTFTKNLKKASRDALPVSSRRDRHLFFAYFPGSMSRLHIPALIFLAPIIVFPFHNTNYGIPDGRELYLGKRGA